MNIKTFDYTSQASLYSAFKSEPSQRACLLSNSYNLAFEIRNIEIDKCMQIILVYNMYCFRRISLVSLCVFGTSRIKELLFSFCFFFFASMTKKWMSYCYLFCGCIDQNSFEVFPQLFWTTRNSLRGIDLASNT